MKRKDTSGLRKRREIYECISQNPGLHMRDISKKLNIPFTTLKYHLRYLEKRELILSRTDGKYNRYFITLAIGENEKKILIFLRKKSTLQIILWFFIAVQCSQKDLGRFLGKHPATIGFHLRQMMRAGIIEQVPIIDGVIQKEAQPSIIKRSQVSSEKIYVLRDPWMIYDFIIKHRGNLPDKEIVAGIIDYVEFYISDGVPKQVQNREDTIESVVKTFTGFFFPPSFCS